MATTLYLEGPLGAGKTSRLLQETLYLLENQPASSILVLCSNHVRQSRLIEKLLQRRSDPLAQLPVYTYAGFVRSTLFNYWPWVEQEIVTTLKLGLPCIRPELSGLEDSELILRWLLARLRQESAMQGQEVFANFPGSDQHILKQVVRRLRLRSENQLSRPEMSRRSALLEEMCQSEVAWLEKQFDIQSYALRVLDPNKQLDIFNRFLQGENPISQWLRSDIRHLVVDDVDETTAAQQRLVEFLAPNLQTLILAADVDGGSRRGYLNAYPYGWEALKQVRHGETVHLSRKDEVAAAASLLLHNWKGEEAEILPMPSLVRLNDTFITRVEMLEQVVEDVLDALQKGYQAGDLCIVLPKTDFLSFHQLQNRLSQRGIPVQLLSGTKRPSDNPKCKAFISLIQWANAFSWRVFPSRWEIKTILLQALQLGSLPELSGDKLDMLSQSIADWLGQASEGFYPLPPPEVLPMSLGALGQARYESLGQWLQKAAVMPLDRQMYSAFQALISPYSTERDAYSDLNRIIQSYIRQKQIYTSMMTTASGESSVALGMDFDRWWLEQVKSGTMADTPEMPEAIRPEALVIGTPQKVIDFELYRKVQLWLDVGAREWARSDNAPLYNAWVHSAVWDGKTTTFTETFTEAIIRARAGHITRTLLLLTQSQVWAYASELDDLGFEQTGLLKPRLQNQPSSVLQTMLERATLRPDQAPILAYREGTMAISAVPGAGKTFVNVELLLELIERGVEPDRILVLTYMDSAAKTLLARLKKKLAGRTSKLPMVSTIHSLAFRILTEQDHALLIGFSVDDMTILDDYAQDEILTRVASATQPESAKGVGEWKRAIARAVTHCKMGGLEESAIRRYVRQMPGQFRLVEFLPALQLYGQELRQKGLLDFTDLIVKAVEVLRRFPEVRARYQKQFQYIIEDEAQDSSRLLQDFIHLLGGERPNLVRTGDTNQSITTTFSAAEPTVFRDFIQTAGHRVDMENSGRCAPEIIELANFWVEEASRLPGLAQAFVPVVMRPVPGQNPTLLYSPEAQLFELESQEEEWLREQVQAIKEAQPEASIAVLVRANSQVTRVASLLQQAGIPAVSLSEQLNVSPVFSLILATLKLLETPGDLGVQAKWYQFLLDAKLVEDSAVSRTFLESTPLMYQAPMALGQEQLRQWYYDLQDFSQQAAGGNISALVARMTDRFCTASVTDRSNGYLCALMAQEILNNFPHLVHLSPLEIVIHQFESFQRSWRGKKSFGEMLLQHASQVVQVMSLHKSKGQEFDVVFMPFLQAKAFPSEVESIRFDESDKLIQELDRLVVMEKGESPLEMQVYEAAKKREKIEEEARLVYVGLTRARRALYLSAHRQAMSRFHKLQKVSPAFAFEALAQRLQSVAVQPAEVIALQEGAQHA